MVGIIYGLFNRSLKVYPLDWKAFAMKEADDWLCDKVRANPHMTEEENHAMMLEWETRRNSKW